MSVTTTDNARITSLRHVLADYELHHSEPTDEEAQPAPPPNAQNAIETSNQAGWETEWRRVPAYRPVQDQRGEQRDTYNNAVERTFIRVMFGGVYAMAVSTVISRNLSRTDGVEQSASWIWRSTGGRLKSDYFVYKIGGEW